MAIVQDRSRYCLEKIKMAIAPKFAKWHFTLSCFYYVLADRRGHAVALSEWQLLPVQPRHTDYLLGIDQSSICGYELLTPIAIMRKGIKGHHSVLLGFFLKEGYHSEIAVKKILASWYPAPFRPRVDSLLERQTLFSPLPTSLPDRRLPF